LYPCLAGCAGITINTTAKFASQVARALYRLAYIPNKNYIRRI